MIVTSLRLPDDLYKAMTNYAKEQELSKKYE